MPADLFPSSSLIVDALRKWLPKQRWYPLKTQIAPHITATRRSQNLILRDSTDLALVCGASARVLYIEIQDVGRPAIVLHVPVVIRRFDSAARFTHSATAGVSTSPNASPGYIAALTYRGVRYEIIDGPHDPFFLHAWLSQWVTDRDSSSTVRQSPRQTQDCSTTPSLRWVSNPAIDMDLMWGHQNLDAGVANAYVITSEQSNSSIVVPLVPPLILKIFRVLAPGPNPDILMPQTLAHSGWNQVPRPVGWTINSFSGPNPAHVAEAKEPHSGHSCVISEFISQADDGFELACAMAARGEDFSTLARGLGVTTGELHSQLGECFGFAAPEPAFTLVDRMQSRVDWALRHVPDLEKYRTRIEATLTQVRQFPELPRRQRIHGDYHLGQVLYSKEPVLENPRGWIILDFEGEPLRPLSDRAEPDFALRDVVGMLRSFDYAFAVGGGKSAQWVTDARYSFLDGYRTGRGAAQTVSDPEANVAAALTLSLELDKALYEAVYESQNRPDWLPIPIAAVGRILS